MRRPLNHKPRAQQHHVSIMETVSHFADAAWRESWNRAFWPSLAITVAAALDGCTRGPSLTAIVLANIGWLLG